VIGKRLLYNKWYPEIQQTCFKQTILVFRRSNRESNLEGRYITLTWLNNSYCWLMYDFGHLPSNLVKKNRP